MRLFGWFRRSTKKSQVVQERDKPATSARPAPQTVEDREPWRNAKPFAESVHNPKNRAKTRSWVDDLPDPGGKS